MEPFVSVVCLTMQDPDRVRRCLEKQTYQNFELLIANDKGIVNAMNHALERARGTIFVRVDDDVSMPRKWLERLIKPFSDPYVGGVTGPTFVDRRYRKNRDSIRWAENPHPFLKWLYDNGEFRPAGIRECGCVSYDSNYRERFREDFEDLDSIFSYEPDHLEGTNWAFRTELLRKVGGFDPKFDGVSEWHDDDAHFKAKKLGYSFYYEPKAYLFHKLGKGEHHSERFEGFGRIKNFLRFHWRHGRYRFLNIKFWVYLGLWAGYFVWKRFKK